MEDDASQNSAQPFRQKELLEAAACRQGHDTFHPQTYRLHIA